MMWIVILALRRPYTFVCVSLLIFIFGVFAIVRMPVDIFPIDQPAGGRPWCGTTTGSRPRKWSAGSSRRASGSTPSTSNDIEHIESSSFNGLAVIKVYFQPDADVASRHGADHRGVASDHQDPAAGRDAADHRPVQRDRRADRAARRSAARRCRRTSSTTSATTSSVFRSRRCAAPRSGRRVGGKPRQVMVDIDLPGALRQGAVAVGREPALNAQNVILPAGTVKMGGREYNVRTQRAARTPCGICNDLPIKQVNGATVYVRDVAQVRQGPGVQVNIVRLNGRRGIVIPIFKTGNASTLDVIAAVKKMLPSLQTDAAGRHARSSCWPTNRFSSGARSAGVHHGGGDRGVPDRPHDPALPGELALDADRGDVDPARGAHFDHLSVGRWARRST